MISTRKGESPEGLVLNQSSNQSTVLRTEHRSSLIQEIHLPCTKRVKRGWVVDLESFFFHEASCRGDMMWENGTTCFSKNTKGSMRLRAVLAFCKQFASENGKLAHIIWTMHCMSLSGYESPRHSGIWAHQIPFPPPDVSYPISGTRWIPGAAYIAVFGHTKWSMEIDHWMIKLGEIHLNL